VTTKYLVDDLNPTGYVQVLEEVVGGAVQASYTYGTMLVSQARGAVVSFNGYDAHGNITFLTDLTGAVTDTYDYDAWGNVVGQTGTTANTRLYVGEELDPNLGLVNLRARQYKPSTGRFFTIDRMTVRPRRPNLLHRYLYADADPGNRSDPRGTEAEEEAALVARIQKSEIRFAPNYHAWERHGPFSGTGGMKGKFCPAFAGETTDYLQNVVVEYLQGEIYAVLPQGISRALAVIDVGQIVGCERFTGQAVDMMSIVLQGLERVDDILEVVTAFPGLP